MLCFSCCQDWVTLHFYFICACQVLSFTYDHCLFLSRYCQKGWISKLEQATIKYTSYMIIQNRYLSWKLLRYVQTYYHNTSLNGSSDTLLQGPFFLLNIKVIFHFYKYVQFFAEINGSRPYGVYIIVIVPCLNIFRQEVEKTILELLRPHPHCIPCRLYPFPTNALTHR